MKNCCRRKPQSAHGTKKIPERLTSLVHLDRYYNLCRHQRKLSFDGIKDSMVKIADEAFQKGYDKARTKVHLDAYNRGRQDMEPLAERRGYERGLAETRDFAERERPQGDAGDAEAQLEEARIQGIAEGIHAMEMLNAEPHIRALSTKFGVPVIRFVGMQYYGKHEFQPSDHVRLAKEYKYEHGNPALTVLVSKNGEMVKAAYVTSRDAALLKQIAGFEAAELSYLGTTGKTTTYVVLFPGITL